MLNKGYNNNKIAMSRIEFGGCDSMRNLICYLRKQKGLKQYHLAQELNVSSSYLSKIETGLQDATPEFMEKCVEFFGLTKDEIFPPDDKFKDVLERYIRENIRNTNSIWKYRKQKGIKQYELARQLGVSPSHLSKIENGLSEPPDDLLEKCADILEVNVEELHSKNEKGAK